LKQVGREITQLIERINSATDTGNEADALKQMVAILTKQMDTLQWLDGKITTVERRSRQLQQDVQQRRSEPQEKFHNVRYG